eukprot:GILK01007466.1.p1 GENE.GILK01007466.1~~GILK01007466.1.p1  ORF type:complete len:468 (+),score=39.55 GILK01007466.1:156-1406(+)
MPYKNNLRNKKPTLIQDDNTINPKVLEVMDAAHRDEANSDKQEENLSVDTKRVRIFCKSVKTAVLNRRQVPKTPNQCYDADHALNCYQCHKVFNSDQHVTEDLLSVPLLESERELMLKTLEGNPTYKELLSISQILVMWDLANLKEIETLRSKLQEMGRKSASATFLRLFKRKLREGVASASYVRLRCAGRNCKDLIQTLKDKDTRVVIHPSLGRATRAKLNFYHHDDAERLQHIVVVQPDNFENYKKVWAAHHLVVMLPENGRKIGYARNWIVKTANALQQSFITMCDDNIFHYKLRDADPEVYTSLTHVVEQSYQHVDDKQIQEKVALIGTPCDTRSFKRTKKEFTRGCAISHIFVNVTLLLKKKLNYDDRLCWAEDIVLSAQCAHAGLEVLRWNQYVHQKKFFTEGGCSDVRK